MSDPKTVREEFADADLRWANDVSDLVKAARGKPVAASLTIAPDGKRHLFAVAGGNGEPIFFGGEDDYTPTLKRLITEAEVVNIGINSIPTWPPCTDPRLCQPGVAVRLQHHLGAIVSALAQKRK